MRRASASSLGGRHGTTVSSAARVQESCSLSGNSSEGRERIIVFPVFLPARGITRSKFSRPSESESFWQLASMANIAGSQAEVGPIVHKFRTIPKKCQNPAPWLPEAAYGQVQG